MLNEWKTCMFGKNENTKQFLKCKTLLFLRLRLRRWKVPGTGVGFNTPHSKNFFESRVVNVDRGRTLGCHRWIGKSENVHVKLLNVSWEIGLLSFFLILYTLKCCRLSFGVGHHANLDVCPHSTIAVVNWTFLFWPPWIIFIVVPLGIWCARITFF